MSCAARLYAAKVVQNLCITGAQGPNLWMRMKHCSMLLLGLVGFLLCMASASAASARGALWEGMSAGYGYGSEAGYGETGDVTGSYGDADRDSDASAVPQSRDMDMDTDAGNAGNSGDGWTLECDECLDIYDQCGGGDLELAVCCTGDLRCAKKNAFYAQCLPDARIEQNVLNQGWDGSEIACGTSAGLHGGGEERTRRPRGD